MTTTLDLPFASPAEPTTAPACDFARLPIRFSTLKKIALSPAHYRAAMLAPPGSVDSPAMRLGRLVHAMVLGGELPAVWDGDRRGKAWADFQAANVAREIVTRSEYERADAIAAAVGADPVARSFLPDDGTYETRIDWTYAGRAFRSTPDVLTPSGVIVDLKTTNDAHPRRFQSQAWRMHYHAQLACYREAVRSTGRTVTGAVLIAVETSEPYAVSVHRLTERALEEGDRAWRSWVERLLVCELGDDWPGYAEAAVDFDLPEWMSREENEEVCDE